MKINRSIAVAGASMLLFAAAPSMASAAGTIPCGTPAKAAVYQTVVTPAVPAVYGPDVKVIDVPAQDAVPAKPGTPAVPAVPEVSHIEHVLVSEAVPEVPGVDAYDEIVTPSLWWNWSPNHYQGPQDFVPNFPVDERGTWQGPHENGGPDGEGTFNVSHGNSGNSSWFHREPAVTIHHDAVPAIPGKDAVYEDVKVIDVPAQPEIPATPDTPAKPAVEEVSHMEKGELITPGTPENTEQVLVSKATPAGKSCIKKQVVVVNHRKPASPAPTVPDRSELAMTGSNLILPTGLAALLLLAGTGASVAYARTRRND